MKWQQLENALFTTARRLIGQVMREHCDQTFYAIALHEYYTELDGQITFPLIAINSLENLPAPGSKVSLSPKYNPADWQWQDLEFGTLKLERLHQQLQSEATRSTQAQWLRTEKRFRSTLIRVVKRLYQEFKKHPQVTHDFFCFLAIDENQLEVLQKCVPKKLLQKHFGAAYAAEAEYQEIISASPPEKFERFRENMWKFEDELAAMGAVAVDFVLGALQAGNDANTAARLLGRIGIADKRVIQVLRSEVSNGTDHSTWCAGALGLLGDSKWLLAQSQSDSMRKYAVAGLAMPFRSWANQRNERVPLNYEPLESLLEEGCQQCEAIAVNELKPGSVYCDISREDVDEVIRGMQSRYPLIRQHAVCVAGERKLGASAGKKLMPSIVERFQDDVAYVRRLAILALSRWKAAAKPYCAQARQLINDDDESVRMIATAKFGGSD